MQRLKAVVSLWVCQNTWDAIHTTDETAQFKDEDCYEVRPLQGEILEELAPGRRERSHREEESRAVPSNVGNAVELICDPWDSCRYDSL